MGGPHEGRERDGEPRAGTEPNLSERPALSRRRMLQLSSLGIAGGVLATPAAAQSLSRTLTIASNGGRFSYTVSVSGELEKSSANGASIDPNDTISGSTATGQGGGGGVDSYEFSGELVVLDVDGDATVTLNGDRIDSDDYFDSVVTIEDGGSGGEYTLASSGRMNRTGANGASIDGNDDLVGSTAIGQVDGDADSYKFSGALVVLNTDGDVTVRLDGNRVDPDDYFDNVVTVEDGGSGSEYTLASSGRMNRTGANGASIDGNDDLVGSTATGQVDGDADSYKFSGALVVLDVDGDATVRLNGNQVDSDDYYDNVLTIGGPDSDANYSLSTSGRLNRTGANGATVDPNDTISGTTATGQVHGGVDSYKFVGELTTIELNGNATTLLNGEAVTDSSQSPVLGIHSGISDTNFATIDRIEEWQDAQYPVQTIFIPWNSDEGHLNWLFDYLLPRIWDAGRIPLITWEPYTPGVSAASVDTQAIVENQEYSAYLESLDTTTPDDIEVRIANGEYDGYLKTWVRRLRQWLAGPDGEQGTDDDRRAYIRLAHEMNGDWYPWSPTVGNSSASSYVEMWRHVHDQFRYSGIDTANIEWMWCVNAEDQGSYTAEELYPGDDYVDWLSVDGYQWGTSQDWSSWRSPEAVFGNMLGRVRNLADKPVCIAETASSSATSSGSDPARKDDWIRSAFEYFDDEGVDMWCWFNEDKETDWAMFNGRHGTERVSYDGDRVNAYTAYREGVDSYSGAGAATSGATPLTTTSFNGE
ncbi:glycosyl hydrolase [Halococcus hamelinensis]|uniref:glycosyl hydrolase n=1 Tax=Halococcus hamelinensis TaxID=332168 RepID=UPI00029B0607|nr:glycosyl hydrolase [Halococcus hamelinensis]